VVGVWVCVRFAGRQATNAEPTSVQSGRGSRVYRYQVAWGLPILPMPNPHALQPLQQMLAASVMPGFWEVYDALGG
jgi:hypothetical protein